MRPLAQLVVDGIVQGVDPGVAPKPVQSELAGCGSGAQHLEYPAGYFQRRAGAGCLSDRDRYGDITAQGIGHLIAEVERLLELQAGWFGQSSGSGGLRATLRNCAG